MEQIFKYFVSRRQAHFLSAVQQNCLANSNCLHVASGSFSELPAYIKSFLGIKKPFSFAELKGQRKISLNQKVTKEIIPQCFTHKNKLIARRN